MKLRLPFSRRRLIILLVAIIAAGLITVVQYQYYTSRIANLVPIIITKTDIAVGETFTADKLTYTKAPPELVQSVASIEDLKGAYAKISIQSGSIVYKSMVAKEQKPESNQRLVNVSVSVPTMAKVVPNQTKVDVIFLPASEKIGPAGALLTDPQKPQVIVRDVLITDVVNAKGVSVHGDKNQQYEDSVAAAATLLLDEDSVLKVKACEKEGTVVLAVKPSI